MATPRNAVCSAGRRTQRARGACARGPRYPGHRTLILSLAFSFQPLAFVRMSLNDSWLEAGGPDIYRIQTQAPGPAGSLPLTEEMLLKSASGDLFGLTQNAGMGWNPSEVGRKQFLILSTQGGVRAPDGTPVALGYHTGHGEIGLLVQAAAETFREMKAIPFAGFCSDPCDGRTQGTTGMFDSLPYRNDAAILFRRLARSLPQRRGVLGIATCDKGLPAMLMAVAGLRDLPSVVVPGGVTLPATGSEDAGAVQTLGVRFAHGKISLSEAAELGCRACGSPGGGCQFLGTAATSQVKGGRGVGTFADGTRRWRRRGSRCGSTWRGVRRKRYLSWMKAS